MRETDRQIPELYAQYKTSKLQPEHQAQGLLPIIGGIAQRLRGSRSNKEDAKRKVAGEQAQYQIIELIRNKPGKYPLAEIAFKPTPPLGHTGFAFVFDYSLGEDNFRVDCWSYNHWGILVQKHPVDYTPEIEIVEKTVEPDKELRNEDPELGSYTVIDRLLHLPGGFRIPVGPLHFESDSLPISKKELAADKARAIEIAKAAGIKVNKDILEMADKFSGPARKYPDRFFYWQPILPESPTKIAIDFDAIEPSHMGLTLKNAPTFNNKVIIDDDDL